MKEILLFLLLLYLFSFHSTLNLVKFQCNFVWIRRKKGSLFNRAHYLFTLYLHFIPNIQNNRQNRQEFKLKKAKVEEWEYLYLHSSTSFVSSFYLIFNWFVNCKENKIFQLSSSWRRKLCVVLGHDDELYRLENRNFCLVFFFLKLLCIDMEKIVAIDIRRK